MVLRSETTTATAKATNTLKEMEKARLTMGRRLTATEGVEVEGRKTRHPLSSVLQGKS
jgi:hypothetical protein